jgi:hypothetical protein
VRKLLWVVALALVACSVFRITVDARHAVSITANQVIRVGANFAGDVSQYANQFDQLIDQANTRIAALNDSARNHNSSKGVLVWVNVGLTVLVTVLAAIAGVKPDAARDSSGAKRSGMVIAIGIIAALASGSQLFVDKLDKDVQGEINAAIELSASTSQCRTEFLRAREPEDAGKATSELQQALLKATPF